MATLIEYKCPCCGGKIEFDSESQNMKCPFCDSEFDVESLKKADEALDFEEVTTQAEWSDLSEQWDDENVKVYICNSCGGEVVGESTTSAASCPFCGNPIIMVGQVSGELKPDLIIPFKLDKDAAKKALKEHISSKKFVPKVFKDDHVIDEIKGVYVPYWLYDCDVDADIAYNAQRVKTWSDSHYNYVKTSFYKLHRGGKISFNNIPVDGSKKMPDDLMESIEPFDMSQAVDFQTAYLSGYLADKYDVASDECRKRADERIKQSTVDEFARTVSGYSAVTAEKSNISFSNAVSRYALYPVWLLNVTWKDQKFTFAMNGQTGKLVGDLPLDKVAFWKWIAILTASIGTVLAGIQYLGAIFNL